MYLDLRKGDEKASHSSPSVLYPTTIEAATPLTMADTHQYSEGPNSPMMQSSSIDSMGGSSSSTLTFSTVSIPSLGQKELEESGLNPMLLLKKQKNDAIDDKIYFPTKHEAKVGMTKKLRIISWSTTGEKLVQHMKL